MQLIKLTLLNNKMKLIIVIILTHHNLLTIQKIRTTHINKIQLNKKLKLPNLEFLKH